MREKFFRLMNEAGDGDAGGGTGDVGSASAAPAQGTGGTALGGVAAPVSSEPVAAAASVSIPENWKEALPEEFRNEPSLGPINSVEALVKSYIHSQKMIGRGKMSIPDQHASDADWRHVYQQLGLPEKVEDYAINLPDDADFADGFVSKIKEVAYEQGILPHQMEGLMKWYSQANNEAIKTMESEKQVAVQNGLQKLKQEWGQAFDQNVNLAKAALRAADLGDHVYDWLNASGMGDDPNMIKILSKLGNMLKEDNLVGDFGESVRQPKELQSRIEELQQSPAYMDRGHVNHRKVIQELEGLFQQLHPTKRDSVSQLT